MIKLKKTILLILVTLSIVLMGCNNSRLESINDPSKCSNPKLLGNVGVEDLDQAFKEGTPMLNHQYRYYDKLGGNAMWECNPEIEVLFTCGDYMIRGTQKEDQPQYTVNNPQRLNKTKTNWFSIGFPQVGLDNQVCSPMKVKPDCAYLSNTDCRNSRNGYLRIYEWEDGWARDCESKGKIFTMSSTGKGYANNTRCAIEQE